MARLRVTIDSDDGDTIELDRDNILPSEIIDTLDSVSKRLKAYYLAAWLDDTEDDGDREQ